MRERSILVCDDEVELAEELGEFFGSHGWRVAVSGSAAEAEQTLQSGFAPTCLLTDLRLADVDGEALVAFARKLPSPLRPAVVAVITGHVVDSIEATDLGADLLYVKPAEPFDILADIERLTSCSGHSAGVGA
jgi:DNA-binding response OmpR family regulator